MTRASPIQPNKISDKERPPLYDALKKGAIALHNFHLKENGKGKRGSSFKVTTGVSYGMTTKGRKEKRIYAYVTYTKSDDGKKIITSEMAIATKSRIPIHVGKIRGSFWVIVSMSKRAYRKIVDKWRMTFKKSFVFLIYLFLLVYVALHPELKDLVMKIIENPLVFGF